MTLLMAMTAALALGSVALPDTPEPEIAGPKTLCFKYSRFQLLDGERIAEVHLGIEGMGIGVEGPQGRYSVGESEIFARPSTPGRRVGRANGAAYYRSVNPVRYAIMGRTTYSPERDVLLLWISGPALTGRRADAAIFNRIAVGDNANAHCDVRYLYGWDFALGLDE